jgi:hypothetical protein
MKPENNLTAQSDLVTFNALGGELGLEQMNEGGLSQAVLDSINAAHYRINSDPISRLGNNHIGGPLITLDVDVSGAIYAHGMAHFTDVGDLPALTE